MQKLANAYVKTLKWINTHSGAEIADKMPADYYAGIGKDAYAKALDAGKAMFTPDGVMPADGPPTVLRAQRLRPHRAGQDDRPVQDLHDRVRQEGDAVAR